MSLEIKDFTKKEVRNHIKERNYRFFEEIITNGRKKDIRKMLGYIGRISSDFNSDIFIELLQYPDAKIRYKAAKNLGKVIKINDLKNIEEIIEKEDNSKVLRELYSAVGRLKKKENIDILMEGLTRNSGKIVMQCIRGLLYHKDNEKVFNRLKELKDHPNEIIKDVIDRELFTDYRTKKKKEPHPYVNKKYKNKLINGDSRKILDKMPDETVHLTFTSPPYYNAKDYSIYKSYDQYLNFIIEVVKKVHRVTKEGRFFVLNTSPVLVPRFSRKYSSTRYLIPYDLHSRIIDVGFEFIEEIIWKKPDASAANRNGGFFQHRKPLAYKANHATESVIVYRKKTHRLIDWNIKQYSDEVVEKSKVKDDDYFKSNVWEIAPSSNSVHPAVFPEELAKNVIKFYSMVGDLVMDPFAGSCTVAQASSKLKRNFVMIEKEKEYLDYAQEQLNNLFNNIEIKK
ncbi:MAG: DNA methyltransferase [Bacillota bacterium]